MNEEQLLQSGYFDEPKEKRKPTDEEIFLSNLKDHPYADSFKGTIKSLEELIEKGVMK